MALAIYLYLCGCIFAFLTIKDGPTIYFEDVAASILWPLATPVLLLLEALERVTGRRLF